MKRQAFVLGVLSCIVLPGCFGEKPGVVVRSFLDACRSGNQEKARGCLVEGERVDEHFAFQKVVHRYEIGDTTTDGERARVETAVDDGSRRRGMTFVLLRRHGDWRISLDETMREMLGGGVTAGADDPLNRKAQQMAAELIRTNGLLPLER